MIDIALFGLGRIGIMHGKNLMRSKDFNLKYIYDIEQKLSKKYSKTLKTKAINKPSVAYKDKNIKAIFIASTTSTHIRFILDGVKNRKIIFCEKPLDLSIKKIETCKKKINKLNPKIQLGFNRRYDPTHNNLRKQLLSGKIGKLEKIIITSRDPAPPTMKYLKESGGIFRDEPAKIIASGSNISDKRFDKIKDFELASTIIRSKAGVQCIITNSRHCSFGYDQRIELFGSKGMLISENKRQNETSLYSAQSTSNKSPLLNFFIERYKDAYKNQLKDFAKFIRKKIQPLAGFEEGRKALIIANAAQKSLQSKKFEKLNL